MLKIKAQYPFYSNFNINNGLLSNRIYNIIEDRNGFIWACTEQGVSRYDGVAFTNFTTKQGLPDNEVLSLFEDSKGRIWFNNFSKEPCYYFNGKIYNAKNDSFLLRIQKYKPKGMCIFVLVKNTNTIAFYIHENGKKLIISKDADDITFNFKYRIPEIFHYILLQKGDDFELRSVKQSFIWNKGDSANLIITELDFNAQNYNYAPDNYLTWLNLEHHKIVQINLKNRDSIEIPVSKKYKNIFISKAYSILSGDSFFSIYNEDFTQLKETVKLSFNFERVFKDKKGNIWLGSFDNGIYFIRNNAPISITIPVEKSKGLSTLWNENGKLIVATETNGLLIIDKNGALEKIIKGPKINRVRAYGYNQDFKFLGVDNGLFIMDKNYEHLKLYMPVSIKDIEMSDNGELLFGTAFSTYILPKDGGSKLIPIHQERTTAVCRRNANEIWLGGLTGVKKCIKVDTGYLTTRLKLNGLIDQSRIVDIKRDKLGNMWIATDQRGLFFYPIKGNIIHFSEYSDANHILMSDVCLEISIDKANKIWLATTNGISVIEYLNGIKPDFKVTTYSISEGMPAKKINGIGFWNDKIVVCANNGLFYFKDFKQPKDEVIKTIITQIKVNSKLYNGDNLELNYNENNLIISYIASFVNAGLSYNFKYKIKELSNEWIQTNTLSVPLLGLEPGTYTFEIAALNNKGNAGEIAILQFKILTPWFRKWWVTVLTIAILLSSIVYYYKLMKEKLTLSKDLTLLRLRILRAQMNPHFVFNALSNIKHLIKIKQLDRAEGYIGTLSLIMRKSINYSAKEFIQLNKEINYTKDYIDIELLRFGDKFKVEFEVDIDEDNLQAIFVPPLIIQPIVENAIKHAFKGISYQGLLRIVINKTGDKFVNYSIIDNGKGFDLNQKFFSNHGLSITKERISILFKDVKNKGTVSVQSHMIGDATGTRIDIQLPI
ncbi:MAG: two-component regulator propeller domain-containing protein [bacterium]|nr:two-component regulator propeller domain-containing protein [bacterium]